MIDLFESIIKSHTVVILSEYVQYNKLSSSAKGLLAQGLRTPSLGTWQLFSRVLFEELQKDDHTWTFADFPSEFTALDKALNSEKTNIIAMRNAYAHGATPSDEQCDADVKKFESFLFKLMGLNWLVGSTISVEDGKVHLIATAGGKLCLHPLLLHRNEDCDASFAFFNDLKNDKVGLLNYPLGKHYKEREFYSEFLEILPLNEWKSSGNNEFQQRIDELTETFKGRTLEREKLLQFVASKNKGYLSIQGNPGIGKSALIAQFFKDLKHHEISKSLRTVEYFIRRGTQQAQVDFMLAYLIRRTDEYFPAGKEVRAEGKTTYDVQSQLFAKWRLWSEQSKGQRLLFLIDGLDEGAENNVLAYLPRENFENILFIYGSRPGGHKSIDDLWATLPTEHHTKLELQGLGKEDIRALIYEVANKYEIERESPWIDAVQVKSQGNPLYLKLLCDSIEHGGVAVNDVHALPSNIDEYYKAILNRYAQDAIDGDALLFSLFTFAAAQDYLTTAHIGHINNLGPAATQRVCTTLKEVLYENPLTEEVLDYQLFHESFREYLILEFAKKVQDAAYRIIDFCSRWTEFEGSWEQRYALEHYAFHLSLSGKSQHHELLLNLITDQPFTATQKKVLKRFEASKRLFQLALMKSIELQKEDHVLESALQLVDLKYEEANDAPQVVALASSGIPGDIELALKRIEQFGGADRGGVQRKFTLYMLCLMELTLLEGRNNPNRNTLIKKLLNHLDEYLPTDHSILSWSIFFSSYLVFLMACEWSELGLDYMVVYKRSNYYRLDYKTEDAPYTNYQMLVLTEAARGQRSDRGKTEALIAISSELARQGQFNEAESAMQDALATARGMNKMEIEGALLNISGELAKQGQLELALETARGIRRSEQKSEALSTISSELAKQGQLEAAASVMQDALEAARGIPYNSRKSKALKTISGELAKQSKLEAAAVVMQDALETARDDSDEQERGIALSTISGELANQGQLEAAASALQGALEAAHGIRSRPERARALSFISIELAKQDQLELALETARSIIEGYDKSLTLANISFHLGEQGKLEAATSAIRDALETARGINGGWHGDGSSAKSLALSNISNLHAKKGNLKSSASVMQHALEVARGISYEKEKFKVFRIITEKATKQGKLEVSTSLMQAALEMARCQSSDLGRSNNLRVISSEFAKLGQLEAAASAMQEALEAAYSVSSGAKKLEAARAISVELANQGQLELALEVARDLGDMGDTSYNCMALSVNSSILFKQGKLEAAKALMQDAQVIARGLSDTSNGKALLHISSELAKQGQLEAALETARGISDEFNRSRALETISSEFAKQGQLDAAASVMQDALETARGISNEWYKNQALSTISSELAKQGQLDAAASVIQGALETARTIDIDNRKDTYLANISCELGKQGRLNVAESIGWEVSQIAERHNLWKKIAEALAEKYDWQDGLQAVHNFQSDEARLFYLKGWTNSLSLIDMTTELLSQSLPLLVNDTDSIEGLLQKYAQNQLFFGSPTPGFLSRLNRSLNIQWLLDICQRFPKEQIPEKSSSNLNSWIDEISDSDDRDDIRTWAEKVAAGNMTEEKFQAKVQALF